MDKEDVVYIHSGILFSHEEKKEILPFLTTWMDLKDFTLSEINQTEEDEYCRIALPSGI